MSMPITDIADLLTDYRRSRDTLCGSLLSLSSCMPAVGLTYQDTINNQAAFEKAIEVVRDTDPEMERWHQIIVCIDHSTFDLITEFNNIKDRLKDAIQKLKEVKGLNSTQLKKLCRRNPIVHEALRSLGCADMDLLKLYRHVPAYADPLPNAISFSWTQNSPTSEHLSATQVERIIESSTSDDDARARQHRLLGQLARPGVEFVRYRIIAEHPVCNLRFPNQKAWKMTRASMPIFLVSDVLPDEIRFRERTPANVGVRKIVRSDQRIKSENLAFPSLNIYAITQLN